MIPEDDLRHRAGLLNERRGAFDEGRFGGEHKDFAVGALHLAVDATGRLDDGIQPGQGAIPHGEVHINSGFQHLGGDHAAGLAFR